MMSSPYIYIILVKITIYKKTKFINKIIKILSSQTSRYPVIPPKKHKGKNPRTIELYTLALPTSSPKQRNYLIGIKMDVI